MEKMEIYQQLEQAGSFFKHHSFTGFSCVGHVWDVFPQYEEGGYFFRSWVFEKEENGEVVRVVMHDEGNQWMSFVCEATVEAMDKQIAEWVKSNELMN